MSVWVRRLGVYGCVGVSARNLIEEVALLQARTGKRRASSLSQTCARSLLSSISRLLFRSRDFILTLTQRYRCAHPASFPTHTPRTLTELGHFCARLNVSGVGAGGTCVLDSPVGHARDTSNFMSIAMYRYIKPVMYRLLYHTQAGHLSNLVSSIHQKRAVSVVTVMYKYT
jgi:hypothetical protein